MATEFGWLIEDGASEVSKPRYWSGIGWDYDHNRAIRYARRIDAENEAVGLDDTELPHRHRICEHGWDDGNAPIDTILRFKERLHKMVQEAANRINAARDENWG